MRRILDAWNDPAALQAIAAELTARADARGELLTLTLARAIGAPPSPRELELTAAHHAQWAPPGTRAQAFERGLPSVVEWQGTTRPDHPAWLAVEEIVCAADPTTPGSPLDGQVPKLKSLQRLRGSITDPHWRKLYKRIERLHFADLDEALLKRLANTLPRFERLEVLAFTECRIAVQDLAATLVRAAPPKLARVELPAWGFGPRDIEAVVQALGGRQVPWTITLHVGTSGVALRIGHAGASLVGEGGDRNDVARARELLGAR